MTGFLIFLCVLLGIIILFGSVLSIPVRITLGFDEKIHVVIKYLFIKREILPAAPKQKKKEKPKKEKPPKEPKPADETPKEKKPNPILEMVKANGYDGMITVIKSLGEVLGLYGGKMFKSVVIDELDLRITVGTGDSAATAIKYGKICQQVYPVIGYICSNNVVRKYDIDVQPDFLANNTEGEFFCDLKLNIRKVVNSTIGMVMRMIFKVVIKFLMGSRKKNDKENDNINKSNTETMKG